VKKELVDKKFCDQCGATGFGKTPCSAMSAGPGNCANLKIIDKLIAKGGGQRGQTDES